MLARLVLADGTIFRGQGFAHQGSTGGEVVFNTAMTGYQEIMTDPSYCGQIVTMTYPLIGNYGINPDDIESRRPFIRALVVRDLSEAPNNWRSTETVHHYLKRHKIMGINGVDTRSLTRHIRTSGAMMGLVTTDPLSDEELIQQAATIPPLDTASLLLEVTTPKIAEYPGPGPRVVIVDLGLKLSIARTLHRAGCHVIVLPMDVTATDILDYQPDGVLYSNGPGNPEAALSAIASARALIGQRPVFGICLGHQVIALALGARTYKLSYGHRGANHPVQDLLTGRIAITSHNHGYTVDEASLSGLDVNVTHRSLNDQTVEGIRHQRFPAFGVQYHPEAFPGPADSTHLFEHFLTMMRNFPKEAISPCREI